MRSQRGRSVCRSSAWGFCVALALVAGPREGAAGLLLPRDGGAAPSLRAERILLVEGAAGATTLAQVAPDAPHGPLCWLLPVPGTLQRVDLHAADLFATLDAATVPRRVDLPLVRGEGCGGGDPTEPLPLSRGLHPWKSLAGAPAAPVGLHDVAQLREWLSASACAGADAARAALAPLLAEGWSVAATLLPEAGPPDSSPGPPGAAGWALLAEHGGRGLALGLGGVEWGTEGTAEQILYVVAGGRVRGDGRPLVPIEAPAYFSAQVFSEFYEALFREQLAAAGGDALGLEWAADLERSPGVASDLAELGPPPFAGERRVLTRLRSFRPSSEAFAVTSFVVEPEAPEWRVRSIAGASVAPLAPPRLGGPGGGGEGIAGLLLALGILAGLWRLRRQPGRRSLSPQLAAGAAAVLAASVLGGCASVSDFRSARVLDRGKFEWMAGLAPARDPRHDLEREAPAPEATTSPRGVAPFVGAAYGIGRSWDASLQIFPVGLRALLRRGLLDERKGAPFSLTVGAAASGLFDPTSTRRCFRTQSTDEGSDDGCLEERHWGGLVELPLTVSQQLDALAWYAGLKFGAAWFASDLRYADDLADFADVDLAKSSLRWTAGLYGGVEVEVAQGLVVVPEIQVMSSVNEVRRVVYYLVPGLALRWGP